MLFIDGKHLLKVFFKKLCLKNFIKFIYCMCVCLCVLSVFKHTRREDNWKDVSFPSASDSGCQTWWEVPIQLSQQSSSLCSYINKLCLNRSVLYKKWWPSNNVSFFGLKKSFEQEVSLIKKTTWNWWGSRKENVSNSSGWWGKGRGPSRLGGKKDVGA